MARLRLIRDPRNKVIASMDLDANEMKVFRGATPEFMMRGLGGYSAWQFSEREASAGRDALIIKFQAIADDAPLPVKYELADKYSEVSLETIIGEVFSYASGYSDSKAYEELLTTDEGQRWYSRYWQAVKEAWIGFAAERGMYLGEASDLYAMTPYDFVSLVIQKENELDDAE